MNRKERRALLKVQHDFVRQLPQTLTEIPPAEWEHVNGKSPIRAWRSRYYLAQLYQERSDDYPDLLRMSVCRTEHNGVSWRDRLAWDELQQIKHDCGYGNWYAVEVYPPDVDVVNVHNFRHLWLLPTPLKIGWFK